ncbi:hypothetical protein ISN45_At04g012990 [Arabidopsis thaliana x Arabidopsis arenosa]|uniref:Uncharacterized protein n=2 Tax=Arabidopsis TaxID=3701 RepID=A0A178V4P9_ARATH|nr:hypothetical protein ISN45_At04g012990 [Arabidopsis thaliana x Arabidopsis arenosa]OAP00836.1 hypothetical protein AXX17_AT4G14560 [Arabidopsis thaliana]
MPKSVAERLNITTYMLARIILFFADRSKQVLEGIFEDVPEKVGDCLILADFVVLAYDEELKDPLILSRSFLPTVGARIDVEKGWISLDVCDVVMDFNMDGSNFKSPISSKAPYMDTSTKAANILTPEVVIEVSTTQVRAAQLQCQLIPPPVLIDTIEQLRAKFQLQ